MDFFELARSRFSVRGFSDRVVEREKLDAILEAGRIAPTARNFQPQRIYVLRSPEAIAKINTLSRCIYGASTVLMVCYDEDAVWKHPSRDGYNSGEVDAAIVCTHMMLAAAAQGVGSCWVGMFVADEAAKAFDLPASVRPVALLPLGYPADGIVPSANHDSIAPKEQTIFKL